MYAEYVGLADLCRQQAPEVACWPRCVPSGNSRLVAYLLGRLDPEHNSVFISHHQVLKLLELLKSIASQVAERFFLKVNLASSSSDNRR